MMLQAELIDLNYHASNHSDLFQIIGKNLLEKDYVRENYLSALLDRESHFPTGLKTKFLNIALPHTDPEVIKKPFIYIVRIDNPITMLQMGDNSEMLCQNFLFLGIKDPKAQVGLLARLMELFSQETFVNQFAQTENETDMFHLLDQNL